MISVRVRMFAPFHGDGDGRELVTAADPVVRPEADALAPHDVHAVVHALARPLGHVVLRDRRKDRRLLAEVDRARGHDAGRVHHVAVRGDAPQGFFDALEPADRRLELAAHPRVGTHEAHQCLGAADGGRRQRDRAASREAAHQHHPALARVFAPRR
jgi:hypothetical protein